MLLKLIGCNVFLREACLAIAHSPHTIDPEFLELGEHAQPDRLRLALQERIDRTDRGSKRYDAILLAYGLCGNATVGLEARKTRLIIPRAHDCCTILLGSRQRFRENFEHQLSTPFSSVGYLERGNYFLRTDLGDQSLQFGDQYAALVEQYGDDNAKYIWESMHPEGLQSDDQVAVFIDIPETAHLGGKQAFCDKIEAQGKEVRFLQGDMHLIRQLIDGNWDPQEFLIVEPGQTTAGVYDWDRVIEARSTNSNCPENPPDDQPDSPCNGFV